LLKAREYGHTGQPFLGTTKRLSRWAEKWPEIAFTDDRDGCLFTATVQRQPTTAAEPTDTGAVARQIKGHGVVLSGRRDPINDLLQAIAASPGADYRTLAQGLGVSEATVKRNIQKLKQQNRIRRIGSKKTGHWEIVGGVP